MSTLVAYLGLLSLAGVASARRQKAAPTPAGRPTTRFAVLIPAHDEESVIADAVGSLLAQAYPDDLFEVHVVGDNCSDATMEIVAGLGAHAHPRVAPDDPGKGPALNWLLDRLDRGPQTFDAFAVIDADTSVDPAFLLEMDRAFRDGACAAQGYYDVRAASSSTATALRSAALACRHHLRPLGRTALGGSCGLFGNGMVFSAETFAGRRWSGHLTEDMEMQVELFLDGHTVVFVPRARLAAEMPDSLAGAVEQNRRWEAGRLQIARDYVPRLCRAVVHGPRGSRFSSADEVADLLVPPLSALVALQLAVDVLAGAAWLLEPSGRRRRSAVRAALSTGVLTGHVVAGLRIVGAPASTYRALLAAPTLVWWKLRLWLGVARGQDAVTWSRTVRNSSTVGPR